MLPFLPVRALDEAEAAAVRNGRAIAAADEGRIRLVYAGRLAAIGAGDGTSIRPETVMP